MANIPENNDDLIKYRFFLPVANGSTF